MTLWNLIRDFFVEHIFGGVNSAGSEFADNFIGNFYGIANGNEDFVNANSNTPLLPVAKWQYSDMFYSGGIVNTDTYMSVGLGDWLSTTFTVITLVLLVMFLYIFVKWIFKLFSGLLH